MMKDVLIVARKELKELYMLRGARWLGFQLVITVTIFGFLLPLNQPDQWIQGHHPFLALHFILIPMLLTFPYVADAFAGERERRTLETLLATPLGTTALLVGKGLAIFLFSYAQVLLVVLAGMIALNGYYRLEYGLTHWVFYPRPGLFAVFALSAAFVGFAATSGIFASLRADSVRNAQRMTQVANLILFLLILLGAIKIRITWTSVLTMFAVVCLLDLVLGGAAGFTFRRERLVVIDS